LDRGDYTLEELLDEEEVLQEVKAQNKRLLELYGHHTCFKASDSADFYIF
jgi:predicted glycoside hydrolase/deacetylase ChbG (UPF0249 family)